MSWFSDLTSKAEALLDRLDQDAAQALQNPDNILNQVKRNLDHIVARDDERPSSIGITNSSETASIQTSKLEQLIVDTSDAASSSIITNSHPDEDDANRVTTTKLTPNGKIDEVKSHLLKSPLEPAILVDLDSSKSNEQTINPRSQNRPLDDVARTTLSNNSKPSDQTRKFKFQTSRLKRMEPHLNTKHNSSRSPGIDLDQHDSTLSTAPRADDIRASINQSLRDYSLGVSSSKFNQDYQHQMRPSSSNQTYLSHYDDQPNLIRQTENSDANQQGNTRSSTNYGLANKRNNSSESFSIDVPEQDTTNTELISGSGRAAGHILRQSAMKRKSAFNLHQVINRLANQTGRPYKLFNDKTKIRLRRAQIRAASYMRWLNYYFRLYPKLKYWMIGYLIVLQLLVIYVLFFYQSTSSSTYLSAQIKEQQEVLIEKSHSANAS